MARFYVDPGPTFERAAKHISAITNANPAAITTTTDHNYGDGDIVRLLIPKAYGMVQADKLTGQVTVTGSDTFEINIDTTNFDTFAVAGPIPWFVSAIAQVIPVGEVAENLGGATQNTLPH